MRLQQKGDDGSWEMNVCHRWIAIGLLLGTIATGLHAADSYTLVAGPDTVSDLVLWLDADDLDGDGIPEGVGEDGLVGGMVSQWNDKSSWANHATQSNLTYRPGYVPDAVGGRSAVSFNNEGQYLDADLAAVEHTIFIVTHTGPLPIANNFGTLLVLNDGGVGLANPNKRQPMLFLRDNNRLGLSYNDVAGVHHCYDFSEFSGFCLVSLVRDDRQLQAFLNGQNVFSALFAQDEIDGTDSIGRNILNGNTYKGEIAEIIVYDRALEDFEYEQVGFYLQNKYGLDTDYEEQFLVLSRSERRRLAQAEAAGLIEIRPVILPDDTNVVLDNDHFGWPVAAMVGDTIVVQCQQHLSHYTPEPDWQATSNSESIGFLVRSTDAGVSWSAPQYIKDLVSSGTGPNAGGMRAIGTDSDGHMLVKHSYYPHGGCLWSPNQGESWYHFPSAFSALTTERTNLGPVIIDHPHFGLMMFSGQATPPYTPMLRSTNGGQTWEDRYWTDASTEPKEPAAVTWDANILLISREFGPLVASDGRYQMLSQHLYRYQGGDTFADIEFETRRTNVRGNMYSGGRSVWAHDTADVCFNPVTGRLELIDSHRWGGGLGDTGENEETHKHTLNLWSIDPADLLAGSTKWRFDGTMLQRSRSVHHGLGYADGCHPGGAVIDPIRNMQHIFVYAGFTDLRAGIYRISRTLDTERLRRWLLRDYATIWNFETVTDSVNDDSGYALPLETVGVLTSTSGAAEYGAGSAVTLDGIGGYLRYADDGSDFFDFSANDAFTLEVLVRSNTDGTVICKRTAAGLGWELSILGGRLRFATQSIDIFAEANSTIPIGDDRWHHVAAIRSGGLLRLYVDHVECGVAVENSNSLSNDADLLVGVSVNETNPFLGAIDFIRISRRALSLPEFLLPVAARGDADFNGQIDAADEMIVSANLGAVGTDLGTAEGDFNADGCVDAIDQATVQDNIGDGRYIVPITDGLLVHLDSSYVVADGGSVLLWPDLAPWGGDNSLATAGGEPRLRLSEFANGVTLPVVEFDGDDYLRMSGSDAFDRRRMTWISLFQTDNTTPTEVVLRASHDDRGDGQANSKLWGTYLENGLYQSHSRTASGDMRSAAGGTVTTAWVVLSAVWDGDTLREYINGTEVAEVTGITAEPFYHQATLLGALPGGGSGFSGRIARVLIYDRPLNATEREVVETFLWSCGAGPCGRLDINRDCRTDLGDFMHLQAGWQQRPCQWPFWCEGTDVNYDGRTDLQDLQVLLWEWL